MELERIVIAADESEAGRQAIRVGGKLAGMTSASISVLRVVFRRPAAFAGAGRTGPHPAALEHSEYERLRNWLEIEMPVEDLSPKVELGIAAGVPSVEITRYAEDHRADLLVLGRKERAQAARLLVGDTADAVARRSRVPCLFVHPRAVQIRHILVALDGSERGMRVLQQACGFASVAGVGLRAVTVEPAISGENGVVAPPLARSEQLVARARQVIGRELGEQDCVRVEIRRGETVEQVLAAVEDPVRRSLRSAFIEADLLECWKPGARLARLAHLAPCSVLTIPL